VPVDATDMLADTLEQLRLSVSVRPAEVAGPRKEEDMTLGRDDGDRGHGSGIRSDRRSLKGFALMLVVALLALAALGVAGCADLGIEGAEKGGSSTTVASATTETTGSSSGDATSGASSGLLEPSPAVFVAEQVGPSVVNIAVRISAPGPFGAQQLSGEGSGVIFSSDGTIITNNHVVSQETSTGQVLADSVEVTLETGEQLPATIVGVDPITDLAVIKVDRTGLPAAKFIKDFSDVKIGQYAIAIGSPLGLENSVTMGIISGVKRELEVAPGVQQFSLVDLIQTDAAISPGNSGGALVDAQGNVIGINVAYLPPGQTGAQNVGFAIPADLVVDVAQQIIDTGQAHHAYLGIRNVTVTEALQEQYGLSRSSGVLVAGTSPDTPAGNAGLRQGDIIIEFDGRTIDGDSDLFSVLRRLKPGDSVSLTYDRDGTEMTVTVTLGERPQ
jgi:S1-C subfamily serine protease